MTDPVDFLLRAAMRLPRPAIERLTEGLIAALDVLDGNADLEPDDEDEVDEREGCNTADLARHAKNTTAPRPRDRGVVRVPLPVVPLQRAWRQRGREWIREYGQRRAQNVGYVSVSVSVPRAVLMWALVDAMCIDAG